MFRGTAMSMKNSPRPRRAFIATETSCLVSRYEGAAAEATTTSACCNSIGRSVSGCGVAPCSCARAAARSKLRFATSSVAPARASVRAAARAIFPAPTSSTLRSRSSPKIPRARSAATLATDTCPSAMPVSVRTRFATWNARDITRSSVTRRPPAVRADATASLI